MVDIPAGWLALIGTLLTAVGTGIGVLLKSKDKDIADRDARIKDLQDRVDSMQARQMEQLEKQLAELQARRVIDERLANTLHETSTLLSTPAGGGGAS